MVSEWHRAFQLIMLWWQFVALLNSNNGFVHIALGWCDKPLITWKGLNAWRKSFWARQQLCIRLIVLLLLTSPWLRGMSSLAFSPVCWGQGFAFLTNASLINHPAFILNVQRAACLYLLVLVFLFAWYFLLASYTTALFDLQMISFSSNEFCHASSDIGQGLISFALAMG